MHPRVLSANAWKSVRILRGARLLDGWVLAGGTGLALQLGHRLSEDLDFFRTAPFDQSQLLDKLTVAGRTVVQARAANTLHVDFEGTRLSFLRVERPLLYPGTPYRGLQIADPRDIAVMKVIAIGGRGSRKDFIDLYFYLRSGGDLVTVLQLVRQRFTDLDHNEYHLLKSLAYFGDAESEPMPRMLHDVCWEAIKASLVTEITRLAP